MPDIKRSSSGNHRKRRRKSFRRRSAAKLAKDDGIKARVAEIIGLAQTYVTYTIIDGTREYEAVRVAAMAEKQFSAANGAIIGELGLILAELLPRLSLRKS